ncbi:hypothetical protein Lal_00019615 [Lupinus albus]|nr:hypothetical protein Lal_00019615 [Lupinus albus]
MENQEDSPPLSPRSTTLHTMMNTQLQALQRLMEQMRTNYKSDYESDMGRMLRGGGHRGRRHDEGIIEVPSIAGRNDLEAYSE